jgi:hypothetical protein
MADLSQSDAIRVRGDLAQRPMFGGRVHRMEVEVSVVGEDSATIEIWVSDDVCWTLDLSQDAAAFLAGSIAAVAGVRFGAA